MRLPRSPSIFVTSFESPLWTGWAEGVKALLLLLDGSMRLPLTKIPSLAGYGPTPNLVLCYYLTGGTAMYIFKEVLMSVIFLCVYCGLTRSIYRETLVGKKGK